MSAFDHPAVKAAMEALARGETVVAQLPDPRPPTSAMEAIELEVPKELPPPQLGPAIEHGGVFRALKVAQHADGDQQATDEMAAYLIDLAEQARTAGR